jgi:hypothetical protein
VIETETTVIETETTEVGEAQTDEGAVLAEAAVAESAPEVATDES